MTPTRIKSIVRRNLSWFLDSGIMHPNDGYWGVAERLLITRDNEAMAAVNGLFTAQTPLTDQILILEHRRADCNFEAAYLFDLAAEWLGKPAYRAIADQLLAYLLRRSGLRVCEANSPVHGLWGWSNPVHPQKYWTDDNAWVVVLALALAARGREELREIGISAARTMHRILCDFFTHLHAHGKDVKFPDPPMAGLWLNPHWIGLMTMAFAWAATVDAETDYAGPVRDYYRVVLDGPPAADKRSRGLTTGLPWTLSEYAYLALCGSIAASVFPDDAIRRAAITAADMLVQYQQPCGHFYAEHYEAPYGTHLADLVYTQNWGTLGLYHAGLVFDDPRYRQAFDRSLTLLASIQSREADPHFRGCWRGMYDTTTGAWGGGNKFEGGQHSIYSGWTNAPITWAFLFAMSGESLLPLTVPTPVAR